MTQSVPATPLAHELANRIRLHGPITFAEFMRECLYHPAFGYYTRADTQRYADFYTSVGVHPIFGRLIARQLAEMWQVLDRPSSFTIVEAGAGTGRLAAQILDFAARELPEFYAALRYVAVEQSAARRAVHAHALQPHFSAERASSAADLPAQISAGCILSNELLDAIPVHRVIVHNGELREFYVSVRDNELVETLGLPSTPELAAYFHQQAITLRETQQAEAGLAACRWITQAGQRLESGFVLTIDYGHAAEELYNERHMRGTMLAYAHHRVSEDFLHAPGEQDLTAHVNFTALDLAGRDSGLTVTGTVSQMEFLIALGRANEFADLYEPGSGEVERVRARLLLKTLINPEGMGETFNIFVQHKGVRSGTPKLRGLSGI